MKHEHKVNLLWLVLLIAFANIIGVLSGIASAVFLVSLDWVTNFRDNNHWLIYFLPLIGFLIGYWYLKSEENLSRGTNFVIEEAINSKQKISILILPMILISTLATHLFGGSAGREGTALQMGGSIGHAVAEKFKIFGAHKSLLIIMGMAGGFGSLFGTPIAASVFAIEVILLQRKNLWLILPCLITSIIANFTCIVLQAKHTTYLKLDIEYVNSKYILLAIVAGCIFGLTATLFSFLFNFSESFFKRITYAPLRPVIGGIIIVLLISFLPLWQYLGLGIPTIQTSFSENQEWYVFLIKMALTILTLSCGFKGGEVTPLFFIGATLGSALSGILPVPVALFASLGFIGVFAGAANTPLACTIMGIELFGAPITLYAFTTCYIAFIFSSSCGIYHSQPRSRYKIWNFFQFIKKSKNTNI